MTLLLFLAGVLLCLGIARFNKSNSLFWLTVISLSAGFIGGTVAKELATPSDKKVGYSVQVSPMQAPSVSTIAFDDALLPEDIAVPGPASRDLFPEIDRIKSFSVLSKCKGEIQAQPVAFQDSG